MGALLIFLFLLPAAYYMHDFWKVEDPQQAQTQQTQFFKNVSMAGGALIIIYLYRTLGDSAGLSVSGPLLFK